MNDHRLFCINPPPPGEIGDLQGHVVLINDSPDDTELHAALAAATPALCEAVSAEVLTNPGNLGFVRTANRALHLGEQRGADVILLNSDALPAPGAFAEMTSVALSDPMISVVSPRSNNATICNSPYPDRFRELDAAAALQAHSKMACYLPPVTYVPTAVGFCLYVRRVMIQEFGVFDEVYGEGYNEENDFVMRCNRAGYRAALANHAFVHHLGKVSFSESNLSSAARETVNRRVSPARRDPRNDPLRSGSTRRAAVRHRVPDRPTLQVRSPPGARGTRAADGIPVSRHHRHGLPGSGY